MTLPVSGALGFAHVNTERGAAARTPMSLGWVRSNTYYSYKNLGSIHGLTWFNPASSKNSVTRTVSSTVTNCVNAVVTIQGNPSRFTGTLTNCTKRVTTNCAQCGYLHGLQLQANCNCNCNCAACNCNYSNCNCAACSTCDTCGGTCTCDTCSACGTCTTCGTCGGACTCDTCSTCSACSDCGTNC